MALGEELRNALRSRVQKARELLVDDVGELLQARFGIHRSGRFEPVTNLPEVQGNPRMRETRELLERVLPPGPSSKAEKQAFGDSYDGVLRAIAFTHLNRLVAFKMLEHPSRKVIRETVGPEREKRGLARFLASDLEAEKLWNQGDRASAYERFLLAQCAQLHEQVGVLFDPDDLPSRVFPRGKALDGVIELLNDPALEPIWGDVETLGWVYQYYTPKELRDKARKESAAPRNAFEMAFRNQFYTPRYVVQFLGDNTLGRLWVEMKPDSGLRERCAFLLVGPNETLPARPKKDPRKILVLDPASGSGHFLLYAFDLLEIVYAEAWDDPELGPALQRDFADRETFLREVPRLIVEQNLHGIDIDRRATQIAALALFLRAKSSNKDATISRSHVVCAEPLAVRPELRDDFKTRKLGGTTTTLARIFDAVCDKLSLAGEAGTLLRIEEEIGSAVHEEKARWQGAAGPRQRPLFEGAGDSGGQLDYSDVTDEAFWQRAEASIVDLLRSYAEEAEGAEGVRRRMFAEDGAEGLRFIDALRRRYDVLCMNPPFGAATPRTKPYIEARYASSRQDLAACFVERAIELVPGGHVGAITAEALFFRRTLEAFRKNVLLARASLDAMAHFGDQVLDTAKIRVAAYSIAVPRRASGASLFIRALQRQGREERVRESAGAWRAGAADSVYSARQEEFEALPYAVFGYWCGAPIRAVFGEHGRLDPNLAIVRQGLATAADFRFVRLRWEAPPDTARWMPFAKGGNYSPYHEDVHLLIDWGAAGELVYAFPKAYVRNPQHYCKPGLTYPRRTNKRFAPRALPSNCVFADKGPAILADCEESLPALLAAVNSRPAQYLLSLGTGMAEAKDISNSYEVGLVQRLPVPPAALGDAALSAAGLQALTARRSVDRRDESMAAFVLPFSIPLAPTLEDCAAATHVEHSSAAQQYESASRQIDALAAAHYGFGPAEMKELDEHVGVVHTLSVPSIAEERESLAERLVSWCMGVAMGRFDVRLATGARAIPPMSDPWDPVPAFSPGMLPDGVVPAGYPDVVAPDGILLDDAGNANDVVARAQCVLKLLWGDAAQDIEKAACRLLRTRSLREYLTRSGANGFWKNHVAQYSRSKRRAPIYWLLQSPAGSFSAWIYAQRLNRDTLYKLLGPEYLGGKITAVKHEIDQLRPGGKPHPELNRALLKRFELLDEELVDLQRFRQTLEDVTRLTNDRGEPTPYDPDLADGMVVAASPLHALIPWPYDKKYEKVSRSELEIYWLQLEAGEYPWSRIAMHYWPTRTTAVAKEDPSVAIAHGLDEQFFPGVRAELARKAAAAAAQDDAAEDDADDENEDDEEITA